MASAGKNKRPRKILTEKYLLDLVRRKSSVNFGKVISLSSGGRNQTILI